MKVYTTIASLTLAGFCFTANAAAPGNVAVFATEKSQGAVSIGNKNFRTKTFEISLEKLAGDDVDLSKFCLKAYSSDNHAFKLDTVDEVLASGILKEDKPIKGEAVFTSDNDAVFKASLVKLTDDCK